MSDRVRAPEIDRPGLEWLNIDRPLSLQDLRGRYVILDFWTSCCINCLHVLPTLRLVEDRFADSVTLIGVHSPKFTAEKDIGFLKHSLSRHDIRHPVIQDRDFQLWRQYAVRAWPTLIFIDPEGYVIGQHAGEPDATKLLTGLEKLIEAGRQSGQLHAGSPLSTAVETAPSSVLKFPGKITALPASFGPACWAIADSGHHRVLLADRRGRILQEIGTGTLGWHDGTATAAQFHAPQGLAATADALYVADTGNHALRVLDRQTQHVTTVAGLGKRGRILPFDPVLGSETALASPWDVAVWNDDVIFANAGTHQIGLYTPSNGAVRALAGSGHEGLKDDVGQNAALAQPSGISLSGDATALFIADSEASAIRRLDLAPPFFVRTVIGTGLFDFGRDGGTLAEAKLQHPLGVLYVKWGNQDGLLIADSYNHAVRFLDFSARELMEFEDAYPCSDAICRPLAEPGGLAFDGKNQILVADTNNHRIYGFDLKERRSFTWLD